MEVLMRLVIYNTKIRDNLSKAYNDFYNQSFTNWGYEMGDALFILFLMTT